MSSAFRRARQVVALLTVACIVSGGTVSAAVNPLAPRPSPMSMTFLYQMQLRDGSTARVFSNGIVVAQKTDPKTGRTTQRVQHFMVHPNDGSPLGAQMAFPSRAQIQAAFDLPAPAPYPNDRVIVVFNQGVSAPQDRLELAPAQIARLRTMRGNLTAVPQYTNDGQLNATLASLGVWRSERLFSNVPRSTLHGMAMRAQSTSGRPVLDIGSAYVMRLANASVQSAIAKLRASRSVAYVSPDWTVHTMNVGGIALDTRNPQFATKSIRSNPFSRALHALGLGSNTSVVPGNYAVAASQQSMLNAPGVNAVAAYDEVERTLHQLPGTGVTITNVSVGDIMDASDATSSCSRFEQGNGPTTVMIGNQRYLDLPTMPLIPVFTADSAGNLGQGSVCGTGDGVLGEIGMDFSVMAPLPDTQQRGGSTMSGSGDLLGIAPGASYRLVVPQSSQPLLSDIDAALLAAAQQQPRPDIITASLGIGVDGYGFPGRYLGDDPLSSAVMAAITAQYNVVLCVSANDGTRSGASPAAIAPSGGAVPTNVAAPGTATTIGDDAFSTIPSRDADAGNIVAGATTLDDIFSVQPQNPTLPAAIASRQVFPEVRWNGFTAFASGYGSLVKLSAPGDNIITFEHLVGGSATQTYLAIDGGTSASAPEIAAGAAVAIQVARAVGRPLSTPAAVRAFLIDTATSVPDVPQSDVTQPFAPQLNVAHAVEHLLGRRLQPAVPRVAIAQRRGVGLLDGLFVTDTDPSNIDLQGPTSSIDSALTGANEHAPITIAPDWEAMPDSVQYQLVVNGNHPRLLASTPYARLFPAQILAAAGMPLVSSSTRTVYLTYRAMIGPRKVLTEQSFSLTFGPANAAVRSALAPIVAPVTTTNSIAVTYDLTSTSNVSNPTLLVSEPGRVNPATGSVFHPAFTMPLSAIKGTVNVPVSALQGGGIYGIGIAFGSASGTTLYSDFAYTRVANASSARPAAPLLGVPGQPDYTFGHYAEFSFNQPYQIEWDARNVPGATGAVLEVSTDAPGNIDSIMYKAFNNPNGSERDQNGIDTGSTYYQQLSGLTGSATFTPATLGLVPTMYSQVRVLAVNSSGTVVGEAGDESTIREDGVVPADGSFIPPADWGITAGGTEGYFAGNVNLAGGTVQTSIERFDQRTNLITGIVLSNQGRQVYQLPTATLYGTDMGIYADWLCDPSVPLATAICSGLPNPNTYIITSIANGTIGPLWNQPSFAITTGASNGVNDEAMLEGVGQNGPPDIHVGLSNLNTNTIDKDIDVNQSIPYGYGVWPPGAQFIASVVENPAKNYAVLGCFCEGSPTLATVDLASGAVQSIPQAVPGPPVSVPGNGFPAAMALDTSTDEAIVVPEFSNVATIYNVKTGQQAAQLYLGGAPGMGPTPLLEEYAAADSVHHLFLVGQNITPGLFVGDNNTHSSMYVVDESGNVVKTISTMALLSTPTNLPAPNLQLNPNLRQAYLGSTDVSQLMPFSY